MCRGDGSIKTLKDTFYVLPPRASPCEVEVVSMHRAHVPSGVALPGGLRNERRQKLARRAASPGLRFLFWETGTLRGKLCRV